jgi:Phage head completion protein (GPL)
VNDRVSIINPPLADAPIDVADNFVAADDWWPSISIASFRSEYRIDPSATDERCRAAIRAAMITALIDLDAWQLEKIGEGHTSLEAVPGRMLDGLSVRVILWQRAVCSFAKADLIESHRDTDATGAGERANAYVDDSILQLRRDGTHAIRDIRNRTRLFAELV